MKSAVWMTYLFMFTLQSPLKGHPPSPKRQTNRITWDAEGSVPYKNEQAKKAL